MGYGYVVLGAGRQGTAAAYDLALFGEASSVAIVDHEESLARSAARRLNALLERDAVQVATVDAMDRHALVELLRGKDAMISAVPYRLNLGVTQAAIDAGVHMCDLGGHTGLVRKQLALDDAAREGGVSIIPDCGLMPGMGTTLAVYAMGQVADPQHVRIFVGGLPLAPRPPFDYLLTFHIAGLSNEYAGDAVYLRDGKIVQVPVFSELEAIDFPPPVGRCEAFVTAGGTSTCPWTFKDRLQTYEEKTVRYPGHCVMFKGFADLGLLHEDPVAIGDATFVPRDVFHALLEPKITFPDDPDVVVLRVICSGYDAQGQPLAVQVDLMDYYDEATGLRAMERTTGFPAAIVAHLMASGRTPRGAVPLELAVDGQAFVEAWRQRGLPLEESVAS
jgi:lysine 6-dehydrogenase